MKQRRPDKWNMIVGKCNIALSLMAGLASTQTGMAVDAAGAVRVAPSPGFAVVATNPVSPAVAVWTQHNDLARTGANLRETVLNSDNVNAKQFGLVYRRVVDDQIYAQPLVMTNVAIPGRGAHHLVLVATVNDSVYAFDAEDPALAAPYWHTSFLGPNSVPPRNIDMTGACGGNYQDFSGNIGIVGTPVIDPAAGTLFLVGRTKEFGNAYVQRLHALDLTTGLERTNSPVVITATYPGNGAGSINDVITFDPLRQNQRPGLALVDGVIYITWASHCDWGPYHGWVIGYDAATLQQAVVFNVTPDGYNGGIWMSGQAPAADLAGNLYLSVGNGSVGYGGDPRNPINRGESFLKLQRRGGTMGVISWFTPFNWQELENGDIDLGSAGLLLIPGTSLAWSGGKQGIMYLVNRDNMGGLSYGNADTNIVQSFSVAFDQIHGGAVWWDGPAGSYGYIWPASDHLQQYRFDHQAGKLVLPAFARNATAAPLGQPGGMLSLSANGTNAGTSVLWAVHQLSGDANQSVRPGILRAYDAQNVGRELWNSEQISARDAVGNFAKFCPPTVANGKVYLATFSGRLEVYGLLPRPTLTIAISGTDALVTWPHDAYRPYLLQTSTNLALANWVDATNTVTVTNGIEQIVVAADTATTFYRLRY